MAKQASASTLQPLDQTVRMLILCGPEVMLQREALEELRATLQARHGAVEPRVFDGSSVALAEVLDELRTQSLLSSYRLVVVDDAAIFTKNYREALERYAQQPVEDATLVLRATAWHPGKLDKLVEKIGAIRRCEPLPSAQAAAWLRNRAKQQKADIQPQAAAALVQRLGTDLTRLDSELGKLAALASGQSIDMGMVEALVGRTSDEQAWVIQEAVLAGIAAPGGDGKAAMGKAIAKVHELLEVGGQSEVLVLYAVGDLFRKLYQATILRRQGASMGRIAQALRLWGSKVELMGRAISRLRPHSAGKLFDHAIEADRRSKSGFGGPLENLEVLLATVADELT